MSSESAAQTGREASKSPTRTNNAPAPKFVRAAESQQVSGEQSPRKKKVKTETNSDAGQPQIMLANEPSAMNNAPDALDFAPGVFVEGSFDELARQFNTPRDVLDKANLAISPIDRWNFKKTGKTLLQKFPQIHLEFNETLFKVREMHRYDLTKNEHRYSIKEDVRLLETRVSIPAFKVHPSALWFENLVNAELNFDEDSVEVLDDEEYLNLLRNRIEEVDVIEKFSPDQKNKRKSRPVSDVSSPSRKKKETKSKLLPKSGDGSKQQKPKKEKPVIKEIQATLGTVFDDIPSKSDVRLRRAHERAFHQSTCSFREISDMILGIKETQVAEESVKKSNVEDNSIPVNFNGSVNFIPRERHSFVAPLVFDGFDSIASEFICPSYEKRVLQALGSHKKRRASTLQDILHEGKLHSIRDPTELKKETKKVWQIVIRKEAPKEAKRFQARFSAILVQCKRVIGLVSKEVKRKQMKFTKIAKDAPLRAKRLVREMQNYWRKSEKDLTEKRKQREKELVEQRKKEEEKREEIRQQRKLEFLLSQTELFSHFIGKKMGISSEEDGYDEEKKHAILSDIDLHEVRQEAEKSTKDFIRHHSEQTLQNQKAYQSLAQREEEDISGEDEESSRMLDDVDLLNPSTMPTANLVSEPPMFRGKLKSYQIKGLNWLVNLYAQGINGILADEMGLGKTIQAICFLGYLAEVENIWGPFLIVAPNSILLQWVNEINKFCPDLKVIPYWGNQAARKTLRKFWNPKEIYSKEGYFHVCVTSYNVFVNDKKYFQRLHWQYLILDEAQAIKSSSSLRWKSLLGIRCRNRLLLTGTPIQNSMAELWALLHFIMPSLFDSHDEFNEWFSKDIESHATGDNSKLNEHQLARLHIILKPFMLRRVKSDVENEMASKIELQEDCSLSHRQRLMYKALRDKLTLSDLSDPALSSKESLMNLVMQFRKVCNHPEIFDRRFSLSPFVFTSLSSFVEPPRKVDGRKRVIEDDWIGGCLKSPIVFTLPKLILDEFDVRHTDKSTKDLVLNNLCNIWFADYIRSTDAFGFLLLNGLSPAECEFLFWAQYSLLHMKAADIVLQLQNSHEENKTFCLRRIRSGLLYDSYDQMLQDKFHVIKSVSCFLPSVISTPPQLVGSRIQFLQSYFSSSNSCWERSVLFGKNLNFRNNHASDIHPIIGSHHIPASLNKIKFHSLYQHPGTYIQEWNGLVSKVYRSLQWNSSIIQVPDFGRLLADSGKMMALDKLLTRLKKEGRRVLIFSQMRKMIDILEDYMRHKKYKMFRLDGTTDVFDRRAMVNEFQESNDVFAFLLSTRAGGLGLTLTAADTVIFYDNDWNPTMDAQAMDRVHRIGQTKQVYVYRLVCKGTIEERILHRAQEKFRIQKTVYAGGFKLQTQDSELFKSSELKDLLLGD